jgi:hypothetical protein
MHSAHSRFLVASLILFLTIPVSPQQKTVWSTQEQPIADQIKGLRKLDDTVRARTTKQLALLIRQLPVVPNKLRLAGGLANLSTEGDFGKDTLQEVTTTLASALREQPPAGKPGQPDDLYMSLASLVRYEHMQASPTILSSPGRSRNSRLPTPRDNESTSRFLTCREIHGICGISKARSCW